MSYQNFIYIMHGIRMLWCLAILCWFVFALVPSLVLPFSILVVVLSLIAGMFDLWCSHEIALRKGICFDLADMAKGRIPTDDDSRLMDELINALSSDLAACPVRKALFPAWSALQLKKDAIYQLRIDILPEEDFILNLLDGSLQIAMKKHKSTTLFLRVIYKNNKFYYLEHRDKISQNHAEGKPFRHGK